jgi:pyridinium-3,5-biscarboxylic acid mononucleotide sulfurtransferase
MSRRWTRQALRPIRLEVARSSRVCPSRVATCPTRIPRDNLLPIMNIHSETEADPELESREAALRTWLVAHAPVAIGYSGGVDSAYLAVAARVALGSSRVLAIIGRSPSYPEAQWASARAVARDFEVPVLELDTAELEDPRYAANPSNRCYFCKTELWSKLVPLAHERGFSTVVDGTNADDLADWRPGAQAAREHQVRSPLADLGFSKRHIRDASRKLGLPTWQQPSSPCLSSRLPYGTGVTRERLHQVERAEAALRDLGIAGDLRVRYHEDLARVELCADELTRWLEPSRHALLREALLAAGFRRVAIDLRGFRSGSLNVLHGVGA